MATPTRYIDLQVNGYGGVDFNQDDLTAEQLHGACEMLQGHGARILATIITEDLERMAARLARLRQLREQDDLAKEIILGFHVEGPFINPADGYRGAHPRDAIRAANPDEMRRLLEAAGGLVRIVTLAPEVDGQYQTIRMLSRAGVVASAGHCDPTLDQLKGAIDAGLSMFTHLGNGCPMSLPRHDNIVQRVLSLADRLWISFIADGVHIPFFALRNYLHVAGGQRSVVVTDAIAPAGQGPGRYTLGRWNLLIGEDLVARAPDGSHLVGSALTMPQAERNLGGAIHLKREQISQLTWGNPVAAARIVL